MNAPDWAYDDDALEAMIRDAVAAEDTRTIPAALSERMVTAAQAAFTWRTVDEELERLTVASDTFEAAVRTTHRARVVQFRGENLTLELEITGSYVVGQVYPTQSGTVTFTPASGPAIEVSTDGMGCFTFDRPIDGPFRLRCDTPESSVITDWLT